MTIYWLIDCIIKGKYLKTVCTFYLEGKIFLKTIEWPFKILNFIFFKARFTKWPSNLFPGTIEMIILSFSYRLQASLVTQLVKNLPEMWETWVRSLGWEDPLEKEKGYPLQYSGLENFRDCIVHGVTKSQTRLSNFHFHLCTSSFLSFLPLPWSLYLNTQNIESKIDRWVDSYLYLFCSKL